MSDHWSAIGDRMASRNIELLDPEFLSRDLKLHQEYLGKDFTIRDLLFLRFVASQERIAGAILDMPEIASSEIGKIRNYDDVPSITDKLDNIADALENVTFQIMLEKE